ncbi:alpha/beta fold hydrolase [Leptospira fluminis]|uniref:Alpha/beta fold hydrolase n=1 Tax=Leptospira fluminis TaxID=2484979 RepID=A0A4R9GLQ1_9LEPT|nr:alpha/beta fold hydrolase [Leptospira fluminis]TGK15731.1 alpha/beta fold hydrolase [Leptospira fluminis]
MDRDTKTLFTGSMEFRVEDPELGISFPVLVQYPTETPAVPTAFGPYMMDVSSDADLSVGEFPLVVISHGNGGSHLLYRTISTHLSKNGYIVAMPEHYGNNRNNNELENTRANLINRPKHVSMTIDGILSSERFGKSVRADRIAVIGHSMGGYTALALAGGVPWTKEGERVETPTDSRLRAIVLMAPGAGWFLNSLRKVTIPILLFAAEHDPITPGWNSDIVLNGVPDRSQVLFRTASNAGHFSFLSPFPPALKNRNFPPSVDPDGFDREEFHRKLPAEILKFLDEKLT